jgi:hypothetical protein
VKCPAIGTDWQTSWSGCAKIGIKVAFVVGDDSSRRTWNPLDSLDSLDSLNPLIALIALISLWSGHALRSRHRYR